MEKELNKGLYFVHGYYYSRDNEVYRNEIYRNEIYRNEIYRNQMILMKDSMDGIYDIEAYDVNLQEMRVQRQFTQGEFVYYDGRELQIAENHPTSIMYAELNEQLIHLIGYENYGNQAVEVGGHISDIHSYHINVGHGNCSIIVFASDQKYEMWMIDCSVFDFTNKCNYRSNIDVCMQDIYDRFKIQKVSKLLVTHLHYDHINGIEHFINKGWIDKNTEVWMNIQYPWKQPTYNRILLQLKSLGVKFVDPIVSNSTEQINILYPEISFNRKNTAPKNNINNASVLYQICLGGMSMLFTGDIEAEGWENVMHCYEDLHESTYYCISHHGSITGHIRKNCVIPYVNINTLSDCASQTRMQVLMGRKNAYKGVYSTKVVNDFDNVLITEDANHYIEIEWNTGNSKLN